MKCMYMSLLPTRKRSQILIPINLIEQLFEQMKVIQQQCTKEAVDKQMRLVASRDKLFCNKNCHHLTWARCHPFGAPSLRSSHFQLFLSLT